MHDLSIIIIGYNTKSSLANLLKSINSQNIDKKITIECIYVDDGSTDYSAEYFEKYNLVFEKQCIRLKKNCGRVYATQKGINAGKGSWFLFVRSNVFLDSNAIKEYFNSINSCSADAFMGNLQYNSKDKIFADYLNHPKRGINIYKHNNAIHYRHLLFGNSLFKSQLFNHFRLNQNLKFYGGEEIDLAERMFYLKNKKILFCEKAVAVRDNHPTFNNHVERMKEFGQKNLYYLSTRNQKLILHFCFYFKKFKFLIPAWSFLLWISKKTQKINFFGSYYFLIQLGLISAIMIGMCKSKEPQNFQNSNHLG